MDTASREETLSTLSDIRSVMERSSRFLSLSGWSGIWAGAMALGGAAVAWNWLQDPAILRDDMLSLRWLGLAATVLMLALAGGFYFTWRKARHDGVRIWSTASRQLMLQIAFPLAVGGVFAFGMLWYNQPRFVAPACLIFYGLALINGGKYTLGEIKVLGFLQVMLGCINLFLSNSYYGLYFWAAGFGALHILYGIIMWNKYERHSEADSE